MLNLDLSKEFDKLSWAYMHFVLLAFGFAPTCGFDNAISTFCILHYPLSGYSILVDSIMQYPLSLLKLHHPSESILKLTIGRRKKYRGRNIL
jgi:hypothetical protein